MIALKDYIQRHGVDDRREDILALLNKRIGLLDKLKKLDIAFSKIKFSMSGITMSMSECTYRDQHLLRTLLRQTVKQLEKTTEQRVKEALKKD